MLVLIGATRGGNIGLPRMTLRAQL